MTFEKLFEKEIEAAAEYAENIKTYEKDISFCKKRIRHFRELIAENRYNGSYLNWLVQNLNHYISELNLIMAEMEEYKFTFG
ncbi:MAG: hypothetical protein LIO87_09525 [Eubacterium sp.]|nr:hypothetical protein [Eubacterium sp.]